MPLGLRGRRLVGAAVVGGAAYHMGKSAANAQAHEQAQDAQLQQMQSQQQVASQPVYAAPAPAAAPGTDVTAELQKLAQLHQSGVLTDAEFTAAKQKLLGV
jgi:hypothetical protein